MSGLQKLLVIIGRIFLSFIFLLSAVHKIIDWHGSEDVLVKALNHTLTSYQGIDWMHDFIGFLIPWASLLLVVALVFELLGGLFVFFGAKVRFGAVLLLLFLIPTTFFFHGFWTFQDADRHLQMTNFLRNMSIFGGLLLLLGCTHKFVKKEKIESMEEVKP